MVIRKKAIVDIRIKELKVIVAIRTFVNNNSTSNNQRNSNNHNHSNNNNSAMGLVSERLYTLNPLPQFE